MATGSKDDSVTECTSILLQQGGQTEPVFSSSLPVFDDEDVEDLEDAPDNEIESIEEQVVD